MKICAHLPAPAGWDKTPVVSLKNFFKKVLLHPVRRVGLRSNLCGNVRTADFCPFSKARRTFRLLSLISAFSLTTATIQAEAIHTQELPKSPQMTENQVIKRKAPHQTDDMTIDPFNSGFMNVPKEITAEDNNSGNSSFIPPENYHRNFETVFMYREDHYKPIPLSEALTLIDQQDADDPQKDFFRFACYFQALERGVDVVNCFYRKTANGLTISDIQIPYFRIATRPLPELNLPPELSYKKLTMEERLQMLNKCVLLTQNLEKVAWNNIKYKLAITRFMLWYNHSEFSQLSPLPLPKYPESFIITDLFRSYYLYICLCMESPTLYQRPNSRLDHHIYYFLDDALKRGHLPVSAKKNVLKVLQNQMIQTVKIFETIHNVEVSEHGGSEVIIREPRYDIGI